MRYAYLIEELVVIQNTVSGKGNRFGNLDRLIMGFLRGASFGEPSSVVWAILIWGRDSCT